jgi:hypothetical protein
MNTMNTNMYVVQVLLLTVSGCVKRHKRKEVEYLVEGTCVELMAEESWWPGCAQGVPAGIPLQLTQTNSSQSNDLRATVFLLISKGVHPLRPFNFLLTLGANGSHFC